MSQSLKISLQMPNFIEVIEPQNGSVAKRKLWGRDGWT
jgi:hypothetical protein